MLRLLLFGLSVTKETAGPVRLTVAFGVGSAAMLAEPPVAEIEKVVGLIHVTAAVRIQESEFRSQKLATRIAHF
jgi:hypothetical protein